MSKKNLNSGKVQIFFFTFVPSLIFITGAILLVAKVTYVVAIIGIVGSLIGGFVCAANKSLISAVGSPSKPVLNVTIGRDKITAVSGMKYSSKQQGQFIANIFFTVIFAVPITVLGWLLFILYCNGKFLGNLREMSIVLDRADDIIDTGNGSAEEISTYFYRVLDYAELYKRLNEKSGAEKMLNKARMLLNVWERKVR